MLSVLKGMRAELGNELADFDASCLHPADAAAIVDEATGLERQLAAVKTLVAARAAQSNDWQRKGHRSAEDWFASTTATDHRDAKAVLETSSKLEELPATDAALRNGELSGPQLRELGPVATPENEGRLLEAAKVEPLAELTKRCRQEKARTARNEEVAARHARIHRDRFFRSWTDEEGAYCFRGRATADVGARIEALVEAETEVVFKQARAEGRHEPHAAYRHDALVRLLEGGGGRVKTEVVIRVAESRLRGEDGICETDGVEVPVEFAIGAILAGAFVKVVVTDGVDVFKVVHLDRYRPAVLDTAIIERDGGRCVRPGCGSSHRLEIHHYQVEVRDNGVTAYWNLATLCRFDHRLVTHGGHRLEGGPGNWKWIEPP